MVLGGTQDFVTHPMALCGFKATTAAAATNAWLALGHWKQPHTQAFWHVGRLETSLNEQFSCSFSLKLGKVGKLMDDAG